jgi:hypothetical protein
MPQPKTVGRVSKGRVGLGVGKRPQRSVISDTKKLADPPPGYVAFNSEEIDLYFACPMNNAGGQPVSGGPEYDISTRVLRTGVAEYTGHQPMRMSVAILLDGYPDFSVLPTISYFDQLAAYREGLKRPAQFTLQGDVPYRNRKWTMEGYAEWDTDPTPIRIADGTLVRQPLTINVLEVVPDRLLKTSTQRSQEKGRGKGRKVYTVKKGQNDLGDVAKAVYGNRARAAELARLNSVALYIKLKPGQKVRLA